MRLVNREIKNSHWSRYCAVLMGGVAVVLLYGQGIGGEFLFDDISSIVLNEQLKITDLSAASIKQGLSSGLVGIFGRPLPMLSFSLDYYFSGYDVSAFKISNIIIHLLTYLVVLGLSHSLLLVYQMRGKIERAHVFPLSMAIALIWALHPLQVSSVVYVVQRMTLMSAFFSFSAIWAYIHWRQKIGEKTFFRVMGPLIIAVFIVLGFLSKENAVLVPVYIVAIEIFIFGPAISNTDKKYKATFNILSGLMVVGIICYLHFGVGWYESRYQMRDFSLAERLYTEARVLFQYISWIVFPNINDYGLFHDDIVKSIGVTSPQTTLFSLIGLFVLLCGSWVLRNTRPWIGFGVIFFLAGHLLESSIIPLELVFEHRNYLPGYGVVFAVVMVSYNFFTKNSLKRIMMPLLLVVLVYISSLTFIRLKEWSDTHLQLLSAVQRHPESARSNWGMARWYLWSYKADRDRGFDDIERFNLGINYAEKAAEVDERFTTSLFGLIGMHYQLDIQVKNDWYEKLYYRLQYFPYRFVNDSSLRQMLECVFSELTICNADRNSVSKMFDAVLRNMTLTSGARANASHGYALLAHKMGKIDKSLELLKKSALLKPRVGTYKNIIAVLLELKNKKEAMIYLEKLKQFDSENYSVSVLNLEGYVNSCCEQDLNIKLEL